MSKKTVSGRYAKSLFVLASGLKENDIVLGELQDILQVLNSEERLMLILKHPAISKKEKTAVLEQVLSEKKRGSLTGAFLKLLIKKNRLSSLRGIVKAYAVFNDEFSGYENLFVESAVGLRPAETEGLKRIFISITGKKVKLNAVIKSSLVGGLRIIYRDNIYDASIKGRLDALKKNLLSA